MEDETSEKRKDKLRLEGETSKANESNEKQKLLYKGDDTPHVDPKHGFVTI